MEELTDILVGLEQRISAYKNRLQELEKKRRRLDDEIATIKKYLELAEKGQGLEGYSMPLISSETPLPIKKSILKKYIANAYGIELEDINQLEILAQESPF